MFVGKLPSLLPTSNVDHRVIATASKPTATGEMRGSMLCLLARILESHPHAFCGFEWSAMTQSPKNRLDEKAGTSPGSRLARTHITI